MADVAALDAAIRRIPNFPKDGILFYDLTGILAAPGLLAKTTDSLIDLFPRDSYDAIVAVEARGFVFAAPVADRLGMPLILLRKPGKLPGATITESFALEYGEDRLELQPSDLGSAKRVLLVDDLIATGGTVAAAARLVERAGRDVVGVAAVVALPFLNYDAALTGRDVRYLISYDSE